MRCLAQICQPQGLVMDIFVEIALFFEKKAQFSAAPDGPVMAIDQDFSLLSKQRQRVINAARPK